MLTADFFPGRKGKPGVLDLNEIVDGRRCFVRTFSIMNRREARKVAAEHGAQPWNF